MKKQTYRWTSDLKKLKIVHIDKSAKIKQEGTKAKKQTFAVFVMNFSEIIDLGDFVIESVEKISEGIENVLSKIRFPSENISDETELVEKFSIISYFLYRTNPSGLWLRISDGFERQRFQEAFCGKFNHEKKGETNN